MERHIVLTRRIRQSGTNVDGYGTDIGRDPNRWQSEPSRTAGSGPSDGKYSNSGTYYRPRSLPIRYAVSMLKQWSLVAFP